MADGSSIPLEKDVHISLNIFYILAPCLMESIGNSHVNYKTWEAMAKVAVKAMDMLFVPFEVKALFFCCQCGKSTAHCVVVFYTPASEESVGRLGCLQQAAWVLLKSEEQSLGSPVIYKLIRRKLSAMTFSTHHKRLGEKQDLVLDKELDYDIHLLLCF